MLCRSDRPDDMRPSEGEASAPDFEKRLEKDPHEADIPDFEGLNVKNEVGRATAHKALKRRHTNQAVSHASDTPRLVPLVHPPAQSRKADRVHARAFQVVPSNCLEVSCGSGFPG